VILAALAACAAPVTLPPAPRTLAGEAFGTTWSVSWRGAPNEQTAGHAISAVLDTIDLRMSSWRADSELSAVRSGPGPVPVSEETFAVVDAALDLAAATGGAFDPTVEPLMALWGYRGQQVTAAPTDDEVQAVRAAVGWTRVALTRTPEGPHIDAGGTALDLSAIAKGHAVDRVSAALSALGATDHLVEIGGEVRAHGTGPHGEWRLGVDTPDPAVAPGTALVSVVALRNAAMATSGNYRSVYEVDGAQVVHTMDPRTGRPHVSAVASATVLAPDCRTADGWATALMVLGPDAGLAAIEDRPELDALLLLRDGDGWIERRTSGLDAHIPSARR